MLSRREQLEAFIGKPVKYSSVIVCRERISYIRQLFCDGYVSEKVMLDIEIYFNILVSIILNEKSAFDNAVKRLRYNPEGFDFEDVDKIVGYLSGVLAKQYHNGLKDGIAGKNSKYADSFEKYLADSDINWRSAAMGLLSIIEGNKKLV